MRGPISMRDFPKTDKMAETLAYGYSPESTQEGFSNEYQHNRV